MSGLKSITLAIGLGLLALAGGCASAKEPIQASAGPRMPDPGADKEYQVDFPDPGHGMARYIGMTIHRDLSKNCGLVQTYFAFDSAKLSPQDKATLRGVAACLDRLELKDSKLSIVGRADARGDGNYNAALGMRRAQNVKKLLTDAGVAESRIVITSRGDIGAVGADESNELDHEELYSHGYDRRVDVVLVAVPPVPH